ncbi:MAG: NAD(P)-dependent oxidoreductase [Xanthomonadales bacterium]|nr:NAD(P)-dependent oxidoreductase [Xanthomonadales bacterium]
MHEGRPKTWGLFGGAGFIGQHLARSILNRYPEDRVTLLDLEADADCAWRVPIQSHFESGRLHLVHCDVRDGAQFETLQAKFDVIVNLAAVHREPGHRPKEYFDTNISGARNLCAFASGTGCREIIFTSSISVYGIHDRAVDESTAPEPYSPYGQSKLEAEQIHIDWAQETQGRLAIIRPGVVFGPGERGNVSRLVHEMLERRRPISLKPDQPKAGIYIEELIEVIHWLQAQEIPDSGYHLVNGVSNENLAFNAFGQALESLGRLPGKPLNIPAALVKAASLVARPFAPLMPASSRLHPERLAKICRPNDVRATSLQSLGYPFAWPLPRALEDWLARGL